MAVNRRHFLSLLAPARRGVRLAAAALLCALMAAPAARAADEPKDAPADDARPRIQVRVEARILEWQISNGLDYDFAVRYNKNSGSGSILDSLDLTLPADPSLGNGTRLFFNDLTAGNGSFDVVVEALETAGNVESLAKPSIILTSFQTPLDQLAGKDHEILKVQDKNNVASTGHVNNTQEIPYETAQASGNRLVSFTQYKKAGLTLDVAVQHVTPSGLIVLDLDSNITDLTGFINVGLNEQNHPMQVPTFDSREIRNRLVIPNNTVFLAGLMKTTRDTKARKGVPWLSQIPVVRWFTSNHQDRSQDSELVFLIKPEIMTSRSTLAELASADTGEGK